VELQNSLLTAVSATVIALLDPMVWEPLVYVQGESLKARGNLSVSRFFELPDHQSEGVRPMSDMKKSDRIALVVIYTIAPILLYLFFSSPSKHKQPEKPSPSFYIIQAKQQLEKRLKDPDSVKYGNVYVNQTSSAVCGSYNARNDFGAYAGQTLFFSAGGVLVAQGDIEDKKFAEMMKKMCTEK